MITMLTEENTEPFLAACLLSPLFGAQLRTDMLIYGGRSGVADFWMAANDRGQPTAALSRIDGRIWLVAGVNVNLEELSAFLRTAGGFDRLTAAKGVASSLRIGGQLSSAPIMEYHGGYFRENYSAVTEALALDELYQINCACFSGFRTGNRRDEWYVYNSRMIRHGFGLVAGIREQGRLAATAGVFAIGGGFGVIGNVATYPRSRGRGHARLLVCYLCDRLLEMGLVPALCCAEPSLAAYYGRMGFRVTGEWERLSF